MQGRCGAGVLGGDREQVLTVTPWVRAAGCPSQTTVCEDGLKRAKGH